MQILNNLLSNAFKYSEKGNIELGYELNDSDIKFYVRDEGIGVTEEQKQIIFDRFTQADGSTRRLYGGTGLGLSISKGLVELLGGRIDVESDGVNGSTFYFNVPLKFVSEILEVKTDGKLDTLNWSNKSILVVEDDYLSFEYIKESLRFTKVNIKHTKTGTAAIEELEINKYDLVLMDIQLPGIDGYTTTQEIRKKNKNIPIIAQTANAFVDDREKSLKAGCNDYISKPIDRQLLLRIINHYI